MRQCIISANCQSVPLAKQLLSFYPFACEYEVEIYTNFTRTIVPLELLKKCDLLIYQRLDETWGELSEKSLLANVNPEAKTVCMPNVMNNGLWPSMSHSGVLADSYWDSYIEDLIARKLTIKEIMYLARKADYSKHFDIEKKFWDSIDYERSKDYLGCDIICDYIIAPTSMESVTSKSIDVIKEGTVLKINRNILSSCICVVLILCIGGEVKKKLKSKNNKE